MARVFISLQRHFCFSICMQKITRSDFSTLIAESTGPGQRMRPAPIAASANSSQYQPIGKTYVDCNDPGDNSSSNSNFNDPEALRLLNELFAVLDASADNHQHMDWLIKQQKILRGRQKRLRRLRYSNITVKEWHPINEQLLDPIYIDHHHISDLVEKLKSYPVKSLEVYKWDALLGRLFDHGLTNLANHIIAKLLEHAEFFRAYTWNNALDFFSRCMQTDSMMNLFASIKRLNARKTNITYAWYLRGLWANGLALNEKSLREIYSDAQQFMQDFSRPLIGALLQHAATGGYCAFALELFEDHIIRTLFDKHFLTVKDDPVSQELDLTQLSPTAQKLEAILRHFEIHESRHPAVIAADELVDILPDQETFQLLFSSCLLFDPPVFHVLFDFYLRLVQATYRQVPQFRPTISIFTFVAPALISLNSFNFESYLQQMSELHITPDVIFFTQIITSYLNQGYVESAVSVWHILLRSGIQPDAVLCLKFLTTLQSKQQFKLLRDIAEDMLMVKQPLISSNSGIFADYHLYDLLINAYVTLKQYNSAEQIIKLMEVRGVGPRLSSFSIIICETCITKDDGSVKRALRFYDLLLNTSARLADSSLQPDFHVYRMLVQRCYERNDHKGGSKVFGDFRERLLKIANSCSPKSLLPNAANSQNDKNTCKTSSWFKADSHGVSPASWMYSFGLHFTYKLGIKAGRSCHREVYNLIDEMKSMQLLFSTVACNIWLEALHADSTLTKKDYVDACIWIIDYMGHKSVEYDKKTSDLLSIHPKVRHYFMKLKNENLRNKMNNRRSTRE